MTDYRALLRAVDQAHTRPKGEALTAWIETHNAVIEAARTDLGNLSAAVEQISLSPLDAEIILNLSSAFDGLLRNQRMAFPPEPAGGLRDDDYALDVMEDAERAKGSP